MPTSSQSESGSLRALHAVQSGREWLQHLRNSPALPTLSRTHFFETLKSTRRLALCAEVNARLAQCFHSKLSDPLLNTCGALDGFDLYAADGHYHSSATHDQSRDRAGAKLPSRTECLASSLFSPEQAKESLAFVLRDGLRSLFARRR